MLMIGLNNFYLYYIIIKYQMEMLQQHGLKEVEKQENLPLVDNYNNLFNGLIKKSDFYQNVDPFQPQFSAFISMKLK